MIWSHWSKCKVRGIILQFHLAPPPNVNHLLRKNSSSKPKKSLLYYPFHPWSSQTFLIHFTASFKAKLAQIPLDHISTLATENILLLFFFFPRKDEQSHYHYQEYEATTVSQLDSEFFMYTFVNFPRFMHPMVFVHFWQILKRTVHFIINSLSQDRFDLCLQFSFLPLFLRFTAQLTKYHSKFSKVPKDRYSVSLFRQDQW